MKMIRFLFVGLANTVFGFSLILLFSNVFGLNAFLSNFLGYCFGYSFSYFTHKHLTFRRNGFSNTGIYKYFFTLALSYGLNLYALHFGINKLEMAEEFAQFFAAMVYTVTMFTLLNKWVFVEKNKTRRLHD